MSKYNEEFQDIENIYLIKKDLRIWQFLINYLQSKGYQINLDNLKDNSDDPYFYSNERFIKDFKKYYSNK